MWVPHHKYETNEMKFIQPGSANSKHHTIHEMDWRTTQQKRTTLQWNFQIGKIEIYKIAAGKCFPIVLPPSAAPLYLFPSQNGASAHTVNSNNKQKWVSFLVSSCTKGCECEYENNNRAELIFCISIIIMIVIVIAWQWNRELNAK